MVLRRNIRAPWLRKSLLFAFIIAGLLAQPVLAQGEATEKEEPVTLARPLVVFNLSSYETLLGEISYVFDTVERPDVMESLTSFLDDNLRGFKGVARDQPMGAMLFLRGGFPPKIEPVVYIPIDDIDEAIKTVQQNGSMVKEIEENYYKIVSPRRTRYLRMQGEYAFIFLGDDDAAEEVLDRDFPDPSGYTKRMSRQYDFCISLDMTSVPKGMKDLGMGFLRAQTATEMQQRDNEPDGVYQMRRAQGERMLEGLDMMLKHGERLELGIDANQEERKIKVEIQIDARKDSPLAKSLDEMNSKRSHFTRLLADDAAFSASMSAKYNDLERDSYLKMIDGLELAILARIDEDKPELNPQPVVQVLESLRQTVKMQHTDMFLQCYGQPPELKVIGGIRVKNGEAIASGLTYLAGQFKDERALQTLELNNDSHQNISFHRIASQDGRGASVLGANPALHVGVSPQVLWFAVGGDGVMDQLKVTMDTLAQPSDEPRTTERPPAMRLVFNAKQWLGLAKAENPDDVDQDDERAVRRSEFRNRRIEVFKSAFENGDDRLAIDVRPTESGGRLQLQLDEGFVRYFAGMAATGFDRRQERRGNGEEGGRRRRGRRPTEE